MFERLVTFIFRFRKSKSEPKSYISALYFHRFHAVDRNGIRRIYDNDLKRFVDSKEMTPELIERWRR